MKKIKILHVMTGGLRREGISSTQLAFFRHMDLNAFEISVAAVHRNDQAMIDEFEQIGCQVIRFSDRREHTARYFLELIGAMKRIKPDIVHVHGSSALMSIELLAAQMAGVKIRIAHSRNTKAEQAEADRLLRPLFNRLYTDAMACGIDAGRWMFGNRPCTVIHNGKDLHRFAYDEEARKAKRRELNLEEKIAIGHVGNINDQKNHAYLLRVFDAFHKAHPDAILYLMGDGPLRDAVKKQAEEMKIADQVIFAGSVGDIADRLQAMDMMLLPSRFEGLPNAVLEWQAEGLPCLISDRITSECAPSDLVAFASIDDSPGAWAEQMERMLARCTDRKKQAESGIRALKEHGFDIEDAAKRLEEMYINLTATINQIGEAHEEQ